MSNQPQAGEYAPEGYCPKCDYPTGVGVCPECGITIGAHALRSKPRSWLHRHVRGLTVGLATLGLVLWVAIGSPAVFPYLPTWYLLHVQAQDGRHAMAVTGELAQRFADGQLSQSATTRFLRRGLDVQWSVGDLGSALTGAAWGKLLSCRTPLPPIRCEEVVQGVRVDGSAAWLEGGAFQGTRDVSVRLWSNVTYAFGGAGVSPLWPPDMAFVRCAEGWHDLEILSKVVVTDCNTGAAIASWPETHRVRMNVRRLVVHVDEAPSERIRYERGKWMPPDRIGVPGEWEP